MDPLCLPRNPHWGKYKDGFEGEKAYIYGAEYQTTTNTFLRNVHDHDVPCAVCLVRNRSVVKMFPGERKAQWLFEEKMKHLASFHWKYDVIFKILKKDMQVF